MPLEATMMLVDNSEYMRNGDFLPTRFDAMVDALNVVFQTKTDSNPENSVGLMTLAGHGPEVLVTHTRELGHILAGAHNARAKIGGVVDLPTAVNVAQLALKHRQNKNLRQRIVLFLGSPPDGPEADEKNFIRLAKKLKKNNIAIDIVAFGDGIEEGEASLLKTFVDNVNSADNSHYVTVPPDPRRSLSDFVISSAVLASDRGDRDQTMAEITNAAGPSADGFDEYGGIDPSLDPELAMVMRMSMEEERARQRAREQAATGGAPTPAEDPASTSAPSAPSTSQPAAAAIAPIPNVSAIDEADDEEAALREALRLSQEEDVEMGDGANLIAATGNASTAAGAGEGEDMDEDEEAAIARAIEMSMQPPEQKK